MRKRLEIQEDIKQWMEKLEDGSPIREAAIIEILLDIRDLLDGIDRRMGAAAIIKAAKKRTK